MDDVILVSRGDATFIEILLHSLEDFEDVVSLIVKVAMPSMHTTRVDETEWENIQMIMPTPKSTTPFRFLVVPLAIAKLKVMQCTPLMGKIVVHVNAWTAKILSYTVRPKLIRVVL